MRWVPVLLALLFFSFIGYVIYLANSGQPSVFFQLVRQLPYGDKLGHIGLFGTLTLLVNWAFGFRRWRQLLLGTVLVTLFVLFEEGSQWWLPNRTLDAGDLLADAIGIGAADLISRWLSGKSHKQNKE